MNTTNLSRIFAILKLKPGSVGWDEETHVDYYLLGIGDLPDAAANPILVALQCDPAMKFRPEPCDLRAVWQRSLATRSGGPRIRTYRDTSYLLQSPTLTPGFIDSVREAGIQSNKTFFTDLAEHKRRKAARKEAKI